jgi:hypothetical protein
MSGAGQLWHLARRFAGSLSRRSPDPPDARWALAQLLPGEERVWTRLPAADQRHAIAVARRVEAAMGDRCTRPVLAAALLHDCGKLASGLGTFRRVGATVWAGARGRERVAAGEGRVARYLRHDALGAEMLAAAGSDPLTVAWAAEHHLPPARWTVPPDVGRVLKAADDD